MTLGIYTRMEYLSNELYLWRTERIVAWKDDLNKKGFLLVRTLVWADKKPFLFDQLFFTIEGRHNMHVRQGKKCKVFSFPFYSFLHERIIIFVKPNHSTVVADKIETSHRYKIQ